MFAVIFQTPVEFGVSGWESARAEKVIHRQGAVSYRLVGPNIFG